MKNTCKQTSQHRRAPRVELICTGGDQPKSIIRIFQQGIVLEMVVDGDKIFQGVSEATLKKRYQLYLNVGKKWDQEKEKRNQPTNKEEKHDLTRSIAQLICGGNEDLWEESIMCKENKKEKKAEESQKEAITKEGAEKIQQFALGKLRKCDAKGSQKDKDVDVDCHLPTQKTPGNQSMSPIPSSSSHNGLDLINQHVAQSEEHQRKGLEIKEKNWT